MTREIDVTTSALRQAVGTRTLADWCDQLVAEFYDWERHATGGGDRDKALVGFVLQFLADPHEVGTAELLEAIDHRRACTA